MAPALIGAIAAGVGAATGLAGGIAKLASSGDKRPELGPQGEQVASNLANTFASRISGTPQLGQGLNQPNTGGVALPKPDLGSIRERLGNAGRNMGLG